MYRGLAAQYRQTKRYLQSLPDICSPAEVSAHICHPSNSLSQRTREEQILFSVAHVGGFLFPSLPRLRYLLPYGWLLASGRTRDRDARQGQARSSKGKEERGASWFGGRRPGWFCLRCLAAKLCDALYASIYMHMF